MSQPGCSSVALVCTLCLLLHLTSILTLGLKGRRHRVGDLKTQESRQPGARRKAKQMPAAKREQKGLQDAACFQASEERATLVSGCWCRPAVRHQGGTVTAGHTVPQPLRPPVSSVKWSQGPALAEPLRTKGHPAGYLEEEALSQCPVSFLWLVGLPLSKTIRRCGSRSGMRGVVFWKFPRPPHWLPMLADGMCLPLQKHTNSQQVCLYKSQSPAPLGTDSKYEFTGLWLSAHFSLCS